MRAVIQRVNVGAVSVNKKIVAKIDAGLLIFLGVVKGDGVGDAEYLAKKLLELRIFNDQNKKMNLNAQEIKAQILVVSQFTLCADIAGGRRPSFDQAAEPKIAEKLYQEFIQKLQSSQLKIEQGRFKEYMTVHLENDGPVTFILDSKSKKG